MNRLSAMQKKRSEAGRVLFRLLVLLVIVLLCAVLYFARYPILRFTAESWIVEDPIDRSDAIIVLSDDNFYADRATRAADLYRRGFAPIVVASGRRLRPVASLAELMEHDLIERGVPRDKILKAQQDAESTREEAESLASLAAQKKWRSVIVVTSNFHTRRARYIFTHVFPAEIRVGIASAHDGDFDPSNWWTKRKSLKELTHELGAMAVAVWELHGKPDARTATQSVVGAASTNTLNIV